MTIRLAHTAHDATHTFRNAGEVDVAYAGTAEAIAELMTDRWHKTWLGYGSPTQANGLFLMVAPGYRAAWRSRSSRAPRDGWRWA